MPPVGCGHVPGPHPGPKGHAPACRSTAGLWLQDTDVRPLPSLAVSLIDPSTASPAKHIIGTARAHSDPPCESSRRQGGSSVVAVTAGLTVATEPGTSPPGKRAQ